MLVLTRLPNEGIWLEIDGLEPFRIVIVDIDRNRVRVGVEKADEDQVRIYRDEVYVKVLQERINNSQNGETESCRGIMSYLQNLSTSTPDSVPPPKR